MKGYYDDKRKEAELQQELIQTLEWYANPENWNRKLVEYYDVEDCKPYAALDGESPVETDHGKKARQALEKFKGENK